MNFSSSTTVQNVLPYIGVSDSGHAEDRFPTRLMDTPNRLVSRVSREEIELMAEEIEATEASHNTAQLLASQALLAIRLCGSVLDQEQPTTLHSCQQVKPFLPSGYVVQFWTKSNPQHCTAASKSSPSCHQAMWFSSGPRATHNTAQL